MRGAITTAGRPDRCSRPYLTGRLGVEPFAGGFGFAILSSASSKSFRLGIGISYPFGVFCVSSMIPSYLTHPMDGPRRKLEWAKRHLDALDVALNAISEVDSIVIPPEYDPRYNVTHFRFQVPLLDLVEFGLIAGDAIHCMRATLDYLAWELAGESAKEYATGFPIFMTPNPGRFAKMTAGISIGAVNIIQELQPAPFGQPFKMPAEFHPLGILHELDRMDKHQTLTIVRQAVDWRLPKITRGRWIPVDKAAILVVLPGKVELPPDFQPRFTFDISFGPPLGGFNVVGNLRLAYAWIESEVLPRFEQFFPERESAAEAPGS